MGKKKEIDENELKQVSGGLDLTQFDYGPFLDPNDNRKKTSPSKTSNTNGTPKASTLETNGKTVNATTLGPATGKVTGQTLEINGSKNKNNGGGGVSGTFL